MNRILEPSEIQALDHSASPRVRLPHEVTRDGIGRLQAYRSHQIVFCRQTQGAYDLVIRLARRAGPARFAWTKATHPLLSAHARTVR